MRIIAGAFKGRKLITPEDAPIRPTSDRAREAIFNLLMHGRYAGSHVVGQHVVDLCCGTGALGLEALSRGARIASFVDSNKRSLELAKKNALQCGATAQSFFIQTDATSLPVAREPAALIFIDAPYDTPLLAASYASLLAGGWLQSGSLIVSEQANHSYTPSLEGACLLEQRCYGKAAFYIYEKEG